MRKCCDCTRPAVPSMMRCIACLESNRKACARRAQRRLEAGLCVDCGQHIVEKERSTSRCADCLLAQASRISKRWHAQVKQQNQGKSNACAKCQRRQRIPGQKTCKVCAAATRANVSRIKQQHKAAGLCWECNDIATQGLRCDKHAEANRQRSRAYQQNKVRQG